MNKYLLRGIIGTLLGTGLGFLGLWLMEQDQPIYKWVMFLAVALFGIGFLTMLYSLIRKIERRSILDERKGRQNNNG